MDNKHTSPFIILIDLDNTIADLDYAVQMKFKEKHPNTKWPPRTSFEFDNSIEKETRAILNEPGFFLSLPVIKDAIEAINEMKQEGFEVFFCTSPIRQNDPCIKEKFQWIEKYFGFDATRKIIISKDKTLILGHYLIDDKKQTGVNKNPIWKQIFFHQPYNSHLPGLRLTHWKDWKTVINVNPLNKI